LLKGDFEPVVKKSPTINRVRSHEVRRNQSRDLRRTKSRDGMTRPRTPKKKPKRVIVVPPKIAGAYVLSKRASLELKDFIKALQPFAERSLICGNLRKVTFKSIDTNANGKLSLAEISEHVRRELKREHDEERGEELYKLFLPTYIRAFTASKAIAKTGDPDDDNYINFSEFRLLNAYLCVYAGMGDEFFKIDGGSDGVTEDDDRRIQMTEWIKGYPKTNASSFIALRDIKSKEDASTIFKEMDADGHGMVLLAEFCDYIRTKELQHKTDLGKLLYGNALKPKHL